MTQPLHVATMQIVRRQVSSDLFGTLEITENECIHFPDGLLGFPECHGWALLLGTKEGTAWLQSTDHPALVFLLVDPFVFFEDYAVDLAPSDLRMLAAASAAQVAVFAIVTLPTHQQEVCTANLRGPLLLNLEGRLGAQIVLDNTDVSVTHELSLDRLA